MKKILWLSNTKFSNTPITTTASWLQPLAEGLQGSNAFKIYNITIGKVNAVEVSNYCNIQQWVIPENKFAKKRMIASVSTCKLISEIIDTVKPDLVHIWGTENIWASIHLQGYIKYPALLEIQGLLSVYYYYYYGGLTHTEMLQAVHLKELIMPWRTLFNKKNIFKKRGEIEKQCITKFEHIAYQSEWVRRHVSLINPTAQLYPTRIMLRDSFYSAEEWKFKASTQQPIVFSSSSGAIAYKGLHVLIKAVAILKTRYPAIQLRLAGQMKIGNLLLDGYSIFLTKLIRKYGLTNNVVFTGPIDEKQIIDELLQADVCVVPSFVETYCLAFAEAMIVGTPVVVSYAGAMPELANHKHEALFYNSLDHVDCAANINLLIQNRELAETLSRNARNKRLFENDSVKVLETQLNIYNLIVNK